MRHPTVAPTAIAAAVHSVCSARRVRVLETSFGVIAAAVGSISAIWWIRYDPVWSLAYIFMGILVLYGLAAHHRWRRSEQRGKSSACA